MRKESRKGYEINHSGCYKKFENCIRVVLLVVFFFSRISGDRKAVSKQKGGTWRSWKKQVAAGQGNISRENGVEMSRQDELEI